MTKRGAERDTKGFASIPAPSPAYTGSAWRARFLRAPKIAMELASRPDFVPLQQLASIKLGLKTGADSFFFLEQLKYPDNEKTLVSRKGLLLVRGMEKWKGELSSKDLKPAILNPHQLSINDVRVLSIPSEPRHVYLFPQEGKAKSGLSEYVKVGELAGVHQRDLVRSNGSENAWYRQVRSLVTSEWVLPYNSAYEYGCWHNPFGAVLNGRFVGADAYNEDDRALLGAVLTSTFAAIGRLVEGVATGVEGAFDVGPPAARKIMLPDFRGFEARKKEDIKKVFGEIYKGGAMLAAPLRSGYVPPLRRELDAAFLVALGLSRGQSASLLERVYTSYGRWRGNIEDVESQMRANRRQMQATGQNRNQRPAESVGRRVWEEIEHSVSIFPKAYLTAGDITELVNVPVSVAIPVSKPLFDAGIVRTKTKNINLGTYERVRYMAMLRIIGLSGNVEIPVSSEKSAAIVEIFEEEQIKFRELASERASRYISAKDAIKEVVEIAEKHWYTACRKNALQKKIIESDSSKLN